MPLGLEQLTLEYCRFDDLEEYLRLLNPTLRTLHMDYMYYTSLSQLHNIREFSMSRCELEDVAQFLKQNRHSLQRIRISMEDLPIHRVIDHLENLRHLELLKTDKDDMYVPLINVLLEIIGSHLISLKLINHETQDILQNKALTTLRELMVCYKTREELKRDLPWLARMKSLQRLQIDIWHEGNDDHPWDGCVLLDLVKALPQLTYLKLDTYHFVRCLVDLTSYLKQSGRKLQLDTSGLKSM